MTKQKSLKLDYQIPIPSIVPTLIKGKDAWAIYNTVRADQNANFSKSLGFSDFIVHDQEMRGSDPLITGQINRLVAKSGLRTAVPTDDIYNVIFPLIKGRFYTDFNALDVREKTPEYSRNIGLWKRIIGLVEQKQGKVKFPFRVQGFYVEPNKNEKGYGVKIVPAENFRIIQDDRLNIETRTRFSGLDETGMIIPNTKGDHTWYSRKDSLSRVYFYSDSDLGSVSGDLDNSDSEGRIILVKENKQ